MKLLFSMLLVLPLSAFAQGQNQPLVNLDSTPTRSFDEQQRSARPAEPVHQEPARHPQQPARPAQPVHQQPIHRPTPVHPAPGPAHHGPEPRPARNHPGAHGEWTPHPGWHSGWHRDPQWHPRWFRVGITFPGFIWLGDIPRGYWQCTAYNQNFEGFSEMGPDQDQAAYGALYDCGGANYEAAGCYVPDGYCQLR